MMVWQTVIMNVRKYSKLFSEIRSAIIQCSLIEVQFIALLMRILWMVWGYNLSLIAT